MIITMMIIMMMENTQIKMKKHLLKRKIDEIENWLKLNEGQMFLPTMDEEDLLNKQDVKHKKETLDLLKELNQS